MHWPLPPAGQEWRGLPRREATLRVLRMDMFKKIVVKHDVGMGEAYMDGDYLADNMCMHAVRALQVQRGLDSGFGKLRSLQHSSGLARARGSLWLRHSPARRR